MNNCTIRADTSEGIESKTLNSSKGFLQKKGIYSDGPWISIINYGGTVLLVLCSQDNRPFWWLTEILALLAVIDIFGKAANSSPMWTTMRDPLGLNKRRISRV